MSNMPVIYIVYGKNEVFESILIGKVQKRAKIAKNHFFIKISFISNLTLAFAASGSSFL